MLKFPTLRRGLKLEIWLCSAICPLRGFQEFRVHHIYIYICIYIYRYIRQLVPNRGYLGYIRG